MAAPGRTVRVRGLPAGIDDDRLSDKLCIHFLRASNGGGDIASVSIAKTTPLSALITFEDSGAAQRVLRHGRHVLRVDGKKYKLSLTEHRGDLDPDEVILSMSVTVDYSRLPRGQTAVMQAHRSHPGLQVDYNPPEERCTLRGPYSEVQAAVALLLALHGAPGTADSASNGAGGGGGASPRRGGGEEEGSPTRERAERRGRGDERERRGRAEPALGLSPREGVGQAEGGGATDLQPHDDEEEGEGEEEDLSLIMDSDTFLYLQRRCGEEYRRILAGHGVEVSDATAQGVTTLFLRCAAGTGGGESERLRGARRDLSRLYQEKEAGLRKAQLPKSVLAPRVRLPIAMEALRVRLPKLLLSEDEESVFIVGSSSDVSEAKQFLLLGEGEEAAGGVAGLSTPPSNPSEEEEGLGPALSAAAGALDARIDKMLRSYEAERKAEVVRGYRLAARFKEAGLGGGLGARPKGSPTATTLGPAPSHERPFDPDRAGAGRGAAGGSGDPSIAGAITEIDRHPFGSELTDPLATAQTNSSHNPSSGSGPGSSLRRTNSFSGSRRGEGRGAEPGKGRARTLSRSSSFSDRAAGSGDRSGDRSGVCAAEVTVSAVMWRYMKEAYAARLRDMTTAGGVRMTDGQSEGSRDVTAVTVTGAKLSAVTACALELQKLVATVGEDFCVQNLRLAELGVADAADETLAACCAEIRQRFAKVTLQILREGVFLIGPQQLCSQVGAALREVFSGEAGEREGRGRLGAPGTNGASTATLPSPRNRSPAPDHGVVAGDGEEDRKHVRRRDSTNRRTEDGEAAPPLARRDAVVREKVGRGGATEGDGSKSDVATSQSARGRERGEGPAPNGFPSGSASARYSPRGATAAAKDSNLHSEASRKGNRPPRPESREDPPPPARPAPARPPPTPSSSAAMHHGRICVCGESGDALKMTACGVTLCPWCLVRVHVHCRVCPKPDPRGGGVRGGMTYSEVPVSLPGHSRDSTVKITYSVPDGVQGEGHPSPGSTFQGGVFEAYLPLCERTHRLLPRLETAFRRGLTFTVATGETGARAVWDCVPHKTSLQGGKSANGYPDSGYLTRLSDALTALGIEELPVKSPEQNKP